MSASKEQLQILVPDVITRIASGANDKVKLKSLQAAMRREYHDVRAQVMRKYIEDWAAKKGTTDGLALIKKLSKEMP